MPKEWNADQILTMARGYQAACVLIAAAELGVFDALDRTSLSSEEVARQLKADRRGTSALLDALVALGLLDKQEGRYMLPRRTADHLTTGHPRTMLSMVLHQGRCLRRWACLAQVVRDGKPAERRPSIRGEDADEAAFIGAMHNVSVAVADDLVSELQLPEFQHLLDVGGASGTWTMAFLRSQANAVATLFDLEHVIPLADQRITEAGMSGRVKLVAGDFLVDPLPAGADLAWVSAIVHQNSREENRRLFSAIGAALQDHGHILIRDVLMDDSKTSPAAGALFAINMLVATQAGGTFTFDELREDLEASGFTDVAVLRRDEGMNSVVQARKR
jgi:hypothetical protein